MNYCYRVFTLTLLIVCCTFALTATIKNQAGVPLPGVAVSFTKADTTVYSDSNGVVYCDIITPIVTPQTSLNSASLRFNGSGFSLSLPTAMDVSLSLYSPRGQEIMHHNETMKNGNHLILPPTIADGIYLMKLQVGEDQFTSKIVRGQRVNWQGSVLPGLMSSGRAADFIDTVSFSKSGYATLLKPIESYKADLGAVTLDSVLLNNNYFGLQKYDIDTTLPSFVNVLFRVYDTLGNNISSITADKLLIKEDGEPISSAESELTLETVSDFKDSTQTVLLIDNSKSVEANLPKIKAAAKEMIRNLIPRQQVAVYAFSENCVKVQAFTSDTAALIQAIDAIPTGYSSTNLYGSLITAFADVDNHADVKLKEIMFGNVVLFTDGKDTQGSSTLTQVLAAQGDIRVFAVGFGQEIDLGMDALKEIALDNVYTTTDPDKLGQLFKEVQAQISNVANSYYWAHYRSPKRGDVDHTLTVGIKGNENSKKDATITGTFNSKLFQAGWAPTAKNLKIELNATSDTLIASYEYEDKDGEAEGDSKYRWLVNGEDVNCNALKLPLTQINESGPVVFEVQPISSNGSPNVGKWYSVIYTMKAPIALNLKVELNATSDSLIASYEYFDGEGDGEGDSNFRWRKNSQPLDSGVLKIAIDSLSNDDIVSFEIQPIAQSGFPKMGNWYKCEFSFKKIDDYATSILEVEDGYLVTGYSRYVGTDKNGLLIKYDYNGDTLWTNTYQINGSQTFIDIVSVENGYVLVGINEDQAWDSKAIIVKIDQNGSLLWEKQYGVSGRNSATAIVKNESGFFVTIHESNQNFELLKIDNNGDSLWSKSLGGIDFAPDEIFLDTDGYIVAGSYENEYWLKKVDESGDDVWSKKYEAPSNIFARAFNQTSNGYVLVGDSALVGSKLWLAEFDKSGDTVRTGIYSDVISLGPRSVTEAKDGYIMVGNGPKAETVKVNKSGETVWTKVFDIGNLSLRDVIKTDGGYVVVGSATVESDSRDLIFSKIDENGTTIWEKILDR